MPLPVASVIEVSLAGTHLGQRVLTVRHLNVVTPAPAGVLVPQEMSDLGNALNVTGELDIVTPYRAMCASNYTLDFVRVQPIFSTRWRPFDQATAFPGTWPLAARTANVHGSIVYRGELAGRGQISVVKPPALAEDAYNGGQVLIGWRDAAQAFANKTVGPFLVTASGAVYRWCIFSQKPGQPTIVTPIRDAAVGDRVGTMRRRTLRVGI